MGRGGMEPGFCSELLEGDRIGVLGEDVEQLHHALDDLDGVFRGFWRGQRISCL